MQHVIPIVLFLFRLPNRTDEVFVFHPRIRVKREVRQRLVGMAFVKPFQRLLVERDLEVSEYLDFKRVQSLCSSFGSAFAFL